VIHVLPTHFETHPYKNHIAAIQPRLVVTQPPIGMARTILVKMGTFKTWNSRPVLKNNARKQVLNATEVLETLLYGTWELTVERPLQHSSWQTLISFISLIREFASPERFISVRLIFILSYSVMQAEKTRTAKWHIMRISFHVHGENKVMWSCEMKHVQTLNRECSLGAPEFQDVFLLGVGGGGGGGCNLSLHFLGARNS